MEGGMEMEKREGGGGTARSDHHSQSRAACRELHRRSSPGCNFTDFTPRNRPQVVTTMSPDESKGLQHERSTTTSSKGCRGNAAPLGWHVSCHLQMLFGFSTDQSRTTLSTRGSGHALGNTSEGSNNPQHDGSSPFGGGNI